MPLTPSRLAWPLWLGWVVFVVYGSLLPFEFQPLALETALARWREIPFLQLGIESRADWVANGVLYVPVGLLGARALMSAFAGWRSGLASALVPLSSSALAAAFGILLALGVEFTQLYFPGRTVSLNDVWAECLGTLLGVGMAPFIGPWAERLRRAWGLGGPRLSLHLLGWYTAIYLLLSLFPYDFLLSAQEWQGKLTSDNCAWLMAGASLDRGWRVVVLLAVEVLLALPAGLLLAARRPALRMPGSAAALLVGAALGLFIECGQLAIASGISQGISVLTRALGVALGVWAWQQWRLRGAAPWLASARRLVPWLALPYLGLLLAVEGGFSHPLRGTEALHMAWRELHLMPFWYHYFTSEAVALFSLGSVALMYLPGAAMLASWRWPRGAAVIALGALAALVEAGKLLLDGLHPDPTNPLIAMTAGWAAGRLLDRVEAAPPTAGAVRGIPPGTRPAAPMQAPSRDHPDRRAWLLTAPLVAGAAVSAWTLPWGGAAVLAGVTAAAALVAWRPVLALALLPLALPGFDLAPWTGRWFWDEFDMLQLVLLTMAWQRSAPAGPGLQRGPVAVLALLGLSLALSTLHGVLPLSWPDPRNVSSDYTGWSALRLFKGALWAAGFIALMRRLPQPSALKHQVFALGLCGGLALTLVHLLWERLAFVGLLDFATDYRVTGPFSAMHTGGAYIESFLAIASAYLLWAALDGPWPWLRWTARALLVPTVYAMAVTYSRNGYGALALVVLVMAVSAARRQPSTKWPVRRRLLAPLLLCALIAAVALPVLQGPFARARLASLGPDQAVRLAHWRDALAMRLPGALNRLLGEGPGSYPAAHYWRSAETVHAGSFALVDEAGGRFLRLGSGAPVYIEQFVAVRPGQRLRLTLDVRGPAATPLRIALCQKWLLTSASCTGAAVPVQTRIWQTLTVTLSTEDWATGSGAALRPVKLAVFHGGGGGTVDVDRLALVDEAGTPLLHNGDFSAGFDRWFFSTDVDPPWHVHSTPVAILFEQGWLGLLAWALAALAVLPAAARRAWRGDLLGAAVLAALLGTALSGAFNTLIDAPRWLTLLGLLLWLAGARDGVAARPAQRPVSATLD